MNYTYKLTSLKKTNINNLNDFVCQTYWKKIGTDADGITGEFSGATPFTPQADADPATFTNFDALTEEIVLEWIKAVVVGNYETHVHEQIQKQIDGKKNPVVEVNDGKFPWSPASGSVA